MHQRGGLQRLAGGFLGEPGQRNAPLPRQRVVVARKHDERIRQQLLRKVIRAGEEERKRIARELHDTTAQTIAALCVNLTMLEQIPKGSRNVIKFNLALSKV